MLGFRWWAWVAQAHVPFLNTLSLSGTHSTMKGLASSRPPLVSAPATATARLPPHRHRRRRLYLSATSCASTTSYSSSVLSHGGTSAPRSLVAAELQSQSRPPPLAAGVSVRGDAATGLAFLLFVLAVVCPPRIRLPTSSCRLIFSGSSSSARGVRCEFFVCF